MINCPQNVISFPSVSLSCQLKKYVLESMSKGNTLFSVLTAVINKQEQLLICNTE